MSNLSTSVYHQLLPPLSYLNIKNDEFTYLGTLERPARELFIFNMTNTDIILHQDKDPLVPPIFATQTDNIFVPAFSGRVEDLSTNAITSGTANSFVYEAGTIFWVRCVPMARPIQGYVWIESIYGE